MGEVNQQQVIDYIKGISVLELSQLVKALESELGVSAAAAMPMAMPAGAGGAAAAAPAGGEDGVDGSVGGVGAGRREDRVQRRPRGLPSRQEDQHHQGRPRSDQPWPQGSERPRRVGAQAD